MNTTTNDFWTAWNINTRSAGQPVAFGMDLMTTATLGLNLENADDVDAVGFNMPVSILAGTRSSAVTLYVGMAVFRRPQAPGTIDLFNQRTFSAFETGLVTGVREIQKLLA